MQEMAMAWNLVGRRDIVATFFKILYVIVENDLQDVGSGRSGLQI